MKNGQKYAKEIQQMMNKDYFECSLWSVRNGKKASEECCHVPESFDPVSGRDEFCKKCLCESLEWLNQEYKEPILSDDEIDIIKSMIDVIQKFGCEVNYAIKYGGINGKTYILLNYENSLTKYIDSMATPWFKNDKFKGMIPDKEYTLEELGISCQQKDNYVRQ